VLSISDRCKPLATAIALVVFLLPAVLWAGFKVDVLYDHTAEFSDYSSYRWASGPQDDSPAAKEMDVRIKRAVDAELAAKGMQIAAEGEPTDLLITYYGGIEDSLLIEGVRYEIAPNVVWTGAAPMGVTRSYEVGTLVFDFADASTKKVVWSGVVTGKARDAGELRKNVEKAIVKAMKRYPPN
jgi:hypothetical protein